MNEFENKESLSEETESENEPILEGTADETVYKDISEVGLIEANEEKTSPKTEKKSGIATFYEYLETFCYALAVMMVLFLFVFRYVTVDGDSMKHTLHNEDKLIISNLFYTPETGDIIVINPEVNGSDSKPIIKRVIATEGQKVRIDFENWAVYVDGVKLDEPYIQPMRQEEMLLWGEDVKMMNTNVPEYRTEFTVGEDKVFVMGDNRNHSKDSRDRQYGQMGENRILGRVIIRITPDFGFVE